jgi:hypothetical protein
LILDQPSLYRSRVGMSGFSSQFGPASAPINPAFRGRTQLGEINIQALMQNAHDLTDTTPAVPYFLVQIPKRALDGESQRQLASERINVTILAG